MKKLFSFLLIFSLVSVIPTSKAQAQTDFISQYGATIDTVLTGNLTKNLTLSSQVSANYNIVEIQFTATKISGTVGGTVTVQESLDGTLWYTAPGVTAYTLTDATQTTGFKITNYGARYIRIQAVGTGTMSAQIKAKLVARKVVTSKP